MDAATQAFTQATLYSDQQPYNMLHLPAAAITAAAGVVAEIGQPFCALIADKDEVTLIAPQEMLAFFIERLVDHRSGGEYRLITFDLPLAPDLIGFMALVSRILTEAGVSILPLAAFERDHILVSAADFDKAWSALQTAQTRLKSEP